MRSTPYDPTASPAVLDAFFARMVIFICPTPMQAAHPDHRSSRIQAKRQGRRDEEIAALDLDRMTPAARWWLRHHLEITGRREMAIARFPHLAGLWPTDAE